MNKPKRIQRKRTKGWRMPEGAVYVGRPTIWGNPFVEGKGGAADERLQRYRTHLIVHLQYSPFLFAELRGKDLACWCPLDEPCHADILLELVNA